MVYKGSYFGGVGTSAFLSSPRQRDFPVVPTKTAKTKQIVKDTPVYSLKTILESSTSLTKFKYCVIVPRIDVAILKTNRELTTILFEIITLIFVIHRRRVHFGILRYEIEIYHP